MTAIPSNRAREEERPQFVTTLMRSKGESDKRELGTWAMRKSIGGPGAQNVLAKKGLHPKMEPYESGGKRTREEETPFADGPNRGRRIRFDPCRCSAGPREEGAVRRLIDHLNMLDRDRSRNAAAGMSAMHCARGWVSLYDPL